jgi:thermitase
VNRKYCRVKYIFPLVISLAIAITMGLPVSAQPPLPQQPSPPDRDRELVLEYAPGEILVKFKSGVNQLDVQNLLAAQGTQILGAIQPIGVLKVAVRSGQEMDMIASLRGNPNVLYAEPNYIAYALETTPNDPGYGAQWGLSKIEAPGAWDIITGTSDVIIAIVDTGIDLDHPDLSCSGKLMSGYNFVSPGSSPDDDHYPGHGTHVAGIAAACTNNATGVAGLAWGARLMPVKVLDSSGYGTYDQVAAGIVYATDQGADIINLSLGGSAGSSTLSDAVQYANSRGRLVVAATGNTYGSVLYPAAYPAAMAVAATTSSDQHAPFSNYGPETDIAAPGVSIYSTLPGSYGSLDGTSMATPYVSGLAALIWSLDPDLPRDQVRDVIESSAEDLGTPGRDDLFGYGRINAWQALVSLVNLETSPAQVSFLIDDDSGPLPPTAAVQVTTASAEPITWTTSISPSVTWLAVLPPASGSVSAAASDSFTLVVPTHPSTYGTFDTTVIVTGATASGAVVGWATAQVRITYLSELYEYRFPIILKN